MLLSGDVGGTKTLLGLFERAEPRPIPHAIHRYDTNAFARFSDMLDMFAHDLHKKFTVDAAAIGVAGPVLADRARLTNVDMDVAGSDIALRFGARQVRVMNDLEA